MGTTKKFRLTKAAFVAWLRSKDRTFKPCAGRMRGCPLEVYLKSSLRVRDPQVGKSMMRLERTDAWTKLPDWAVTFVSVVDRKAWDELTAQDMLWILQ